jgi:hypothetical protein
LAEYPEKLASKAVLNLFDSSDLLPDSHSPNHIWTDEALIASNPSLAIFSRNYKGEKTFDKL